MLLNAGDGQPFLQAVARSKGGTREQLAHLATHGLSLSKQAVRSAVEAIAGDDVEKAAHLFDGLVEALGDAHSPPSGLERRRRAAAVLGEAAVANVDSRYRVMSLVTSIEEQTAHGAKGGSGERGARSSLRTNLAHPNSLQQAEKSRTLFVISPKSFRVNRNFWDQLTNQKGRKLLPRAVNVNGRQITDLPRPPRAPTMHSKRRGD